ncbi:hypothetical protein [Myxococcus xanthus]|uniref:hypothetical protein n=1 Tax=Myxococcus xanthus TaxID=34 RepID=UPI00191D567F|nr:hypothetical protein [Myxococcus xanthus]
MPPITHLIQQARPELALLEANAKRVPASPFSPTNNRIEAVVHGGSGPKAALEAARRVQLVRLYLWAEHRARRGPALLPTPARAEASPAG